MHESSPHRVFNTRPGGACAEPPRQLALPPTLTNPTIKSHCPTADRLGFYCFLLQETKERVNNTSSGHQA